MKPRRLLLGMLSAALAFLAAACSDSPGAGPLGDGGLKAVWCASGTKGVTVAMGVYALRNDGSSSITIRAVTLPKLVRLTMTKAYLVPIRNKTLIGEASWPPKAPAWQQRQPAIGGTIKPGQTLNLVFGLTMTTSRGGYSSGPLIIYSAGANAYSMQEQTALTVGQQSACAMPPGVT
jgi:hypothetical protein